MRKRIVSTILVYSLILTMGWFSLLLLEDALRPNYISCFIGDLDRAPTFIERYFDNVFTILSIILNSIVFILLGYHLNKKYG